METAPEGKAMQRVRIFLALAMLVVGGLVSLAGLAAVCIDSNGGAASCGASCSRNGTSCSCEGECTSGEIKYVLAH